MGWRPRLEDLSADLACENGEAEGRQPGELRCLRSSGFSPLRPQVGLAAEGIQLGAGELLTAAPSRPGRKSWRRRLEGLAADLGCENGEAEGRQSRDMRCLRSSGFSPLVLELEV